MPHNVPLSENVFDVMSTMRAMRRLKPDPVPDALIFKILAAGQAAASGGNTQRWKFLVLKDAVAKKKAVQTYYKKLFDEVVGPRYASSPVPPGVKADSFKRQHSAVEWRAPACSYSDAAASPGCDRDVARRIGRRRHRARRRHPS